MSIIIKYSGATSGHVYMKVTRPRFLRIFELSLVVCVMRPRFRSNEVILDDKPYRFQWVNNILGTPHDKNALDDVGWDCRGVF